MANCKHGDEVVLLHCCKAYLIPFFDILCTPSVRYQVQTLSSIFDKHNFPAAACVYERRYFVPGLLICCSGF